MSQSFEVDWRGTKEEGPVFRVGLEFGVTEAAELRGRLVELGARVPVRVDFAHAATVSDHALAELLEWVVDRYHGRVAFVGLDAHHERMLRYLVPRAAQALIL
jgi:thioredoxin-like negative regulator of GroEL